METKQKNENGGKEVNFLEELNPFDISDKEMEKCEDIVYKLHRDDLERYNKVNEIVCRLKLGGLWRGRDASMVILIDAIFGLKGGDC